MAQQQMILFLCTGNYCRSRFAEVLFNSVAGKFGLSWRASSRGLALEGGINNIGPMAASAITALEPLGIHAAEAVTQPPLPATHPTPGRLPLPRSLKRRPAPPPLGF